jgi:wobble nucleotide-excising tRNase
VNDLLVRFGAQFKLETVEVEYVGRTPRAGYTFALRGKTIDPGSDKTPVGEPCFRNTLSSGDRNTLALAFFIAQLKTRADLADLVVVFDDPFTSLDSFRQTWTCASIRKLATTAKQVVVLSHSLEFLRLISNRCETGTLSTLKIDLHNTIDSRIIELDLDDATATMVDKDIIKVKSYVMGDDKDANGAVRSIRPLLENYIRKMAPDDAPGGNGWLGGFLGDIKKADAASPLGQFKPIYDDLDNLNEYTSPYAHDSGTSPPINEAELHTNAGMALKLIGRG